MSRTQRLTFRRQSGGKDRVMFATTMEMIGRLTTERSALYQNASTGAGDQGVRQRVREIASELEGLWNLRRQERAGTREGIDLLVHNVYQRLYGPTYESVVRPPAVAEAEDEVKGVAA